MSAASTNRSYIVVEANVFLYVYPLNVLIGWVALLANLVLETGHLD
jgi:hypothetical protein